MPAVRKWKAEDTVRAWSPFETRIDGRVVLVSTKQHLPGDHPAVVMLPGRFIRADAPEAHAHRARSEAERERMCRQARREAEKAREREEQEAEKERQRAASRREYRRVHALNNGVGS